MADSELRDIPGEETSPTGADLIAVQNPVTGDLEKMTLTTLLGLTSPSASTTVAGQAEIATVAEVDGGTDNTRIVSPQGLANSELQAKVDAIEAGADVTNETNVTGALDGATFTDVGTPAATDRVLLQDADAAGAIKTANFSTFTGLTEVVNDTTPQLGGDLDLNGFEITGMAIGADIQPYSAALDAVSGNNSGDETPASLTNAGIVELATIVETDAGSSQSLALTPNGLAGSALQTKVDALSNINTQTGTTYTLALSDAWGTTEMNNASANTVTIPLNAAVAFPVGTRLDIVQYGAGATTVSPASGVTVNGDIYDLTMTGGQYARATLYKRATNEWVAVGSADPEQVIPPVNDPPAAPTVSLISVIDTQLVFSWSSNGDGGSAITSWEYQTDDHSDFSSPYVSASGIGAGVSSTTVNGLTASTTYYTRVRAVNAVGNGTWSTTLTQATTAASTAPTANIVAETFTDPTGSFGTTSGDADVVAAATDNGGGIDATSVLLSPSGLTAETTADGDWSVNATTGVVTFAPADGFRGTAENFFTVQNTANTATSNAAKVQLTYDALLFVQDTAVRTTGTPTDTVTPANLTATLNAASPGDVIEVSDGTYTGAAVTWSANGTNGNEIIVYAENEGGVVWAPTTASTNGITLSGSYLKIDGFDFSSSEGQANFRNTSGSNVTFSNCTFRQGNNERYVFMMTGGDEIAFEWCDFLDGVWIDNNQNWENCQFYGVGAGIGRFTNCYFSKGNPGISVLMNKCDGTYVNKCEFTNTGKGVFVQRSGSPAYSGTWSGFQFNDNYCHHTGTFTAGTDNLGDDAGDGTNAFQCNGILDEPNCEILRNISTRTNGATSSEDHINIGSSGGTSGSHMLILDNRISGGGPSTSSTGIICGDGGGDYVDMYNNICVRPGQVGMGAGGGFNIRVYNNKIWSDQQLWTNRAMYSYSTGPSFAVCGTHTIVDNETYFVNGVADGTPDGDVLGLYDPGDCPNPTQTGNDWAASLDINIIDTYYDRTAPS